MGDRTCLVEETSVSAQKDGSEEPLILERSVPHKPHHGMWGLPGSGIEPVSPALAGRFFTLGPPGKPVVVSF